MWLIVMESVWFSNVIRVYGCGTVPMVYKFDTFRKAGGVAIRILEATQGEQFRLFGGHEETMIDSGHWPSIFARSREEAMTADMCPGSGFNTAMPLLKVFCQIVCRWVTMRSVSAERPLSGSSASILARTGYLELIVALS